MLDRGFSFQNRMVQVTIWRIKRNLHMASIKINGRFYRMYPPEKFLGHAEKELMLDTNHTVFLLVDVYGLGADPDKPDEKSDWMGLAADQNADPHNAIIVNKMRPALDAA